MFVHPPRGGRGGGAASLNAADTAPGVARARASSSSKNAAPCAGVGYLVRLSSAVSVMTRSASKPSGTWTTFHRLRSNSAEPPSSASVSAICMVTSANRTRGLAPGDEVPVDRSPCRPPARKTEIAGHTPIATPVIDDQQGGDDEHADVNRRVRDAEYVCRRHRDERPQERECRKEPDTAGRQREQQAFGERQASESNLAGADGGSDRELPLALGHAREHEVGDVHARDEQEDGHGSHEQPADPRRVADPAVAHRLHFPGDTPGRRPELLHLRHLGRQHQFRALGCHARLEARERHHQGRKGHTRVERTQLSREQDVGGFRRHLEIRRQDADDRDLLHRRERSFQTQRASDDGGSAP